jgi:hypothetical protein
MKQVPYWRTTRVFLVVKGPVADATDAPQPWGFLCNPVMKMMMMMITIFCPFHSNGAPVEWNWQGKTCPNATLSATNPTWTDPGSNPGLRGGRPAANSLSPGTAWPHVLGGTVQNVVAGRLCARNWAPLDEMFFSIAWLVAWTGRKSLDL